MRFAVESWAPEYGAPMGDEATLEAEAPADVDVEVPAAEWAPRSPAPTARRLESLLFVDGVRRIDAHLWVTGDDGDARHGICASYAAGAVRCDGAARLVEARVRRGLFCATEGAEPLNTRHGTFDLHVSPDDDPVKLSLLLQARMGALEAQVAQAAGDDGVTSEGGGEVVVVVDGPLKVGHRSPGMVGYVKTHRQHYGPQVVRDVVARLATGQRSPLLLVGERQPRFTWYLRLPTAATHAWAGVVRVETPAELPVLEAASLADDLALTLPAYASVAHKDPRAPQNLVPIGGLERELRRRMGDQALIFRALQEAASAGDPRIPTL